MNDSPSLMLDQYPPITTPKLSKEDTLLMFSNKKIINIPSDMAS